MVIKPSSVVQGWKEFFAKQEIDCLSLKQVCLVVVLSNSQEIKVFRKQTEQVP